MGVDLLSKLYVLDHVYQVYNDVNEKNRKFLQQKLLGIFDSSELALINIEKYKNIRGFNESIEGLSISEYTIDSIFNDYLNKLLINSSPRFTLSKVYRLYYVFEYPDGYEDIELLGLFSSKAATQKAKKVLMHDSRFKRFFSHINSFQHQINIPQWTEGFIKWEQAMEEKKNSK